MAPSLFPSSGTSNEPRAIQVDLDTTIWNDALADHGIDPDAPRFVSEAVNQRRHNVFHQLRATPPDWLAWWAGERPTDPTAATVYDDHIRTLATWRDEQRIADECPGFGPMPADPAIADQWRANMDSSLAVRNWLAQHTNEPVGLPTISITDARHRLTELDDLFATAPADQRLIVDELIASPHIDIADKIDALQLAGAQQSQRRDWILEHCPTSSNTTNSPPSSTPQDLSPTGQPPYRPAPSNSSRNSAAPSSTPPKTGPSPNSKKRSHAAHPSTTSEACATS